MKLVTLAYVKTTQEKAPAHQVQTTDDDGSIAIVKQTTTAAKAREFADRLVGKAPSKFKRSYPDPVERAGKNGETIDSEIEALLDAE
jgi:hypothetical protein